MNACPNFLIMLKLYKVKLVLGRQLSLRIIAGEWKGKPLKPVKGIKTRPTTDRVKESVFNIIQSYIPDSFVLDLFSGTGNMGLEALSRGANRAIFVEKSRGAAAVLKENCASLRYTDKVDIFVNDVFTTIPYLGRKGHGFNIIFADPPYSKEIEPLLLGAISKANILNNNGVFIIEHASKDVLPSSLDTLKKVDYRKYGNTSISIYEKDDEL